MLSAHSPGAFLAPHLAGFDWESATTGWMYGYGFILHTVDGGGSWIDKTPTDIANLVYPKARCCKMQSPPPRVVSVRTLRGTDGGHLRSLLLSSD